MPSIQHHHHPVLFLLIVAIFFNVGICQDDDTNQPVFKLNNDVSIPLIGMGIGNLAHESIPQVVNAQIGAGVQLIDTAHASNNERILGEAIASFDASGGARSHTRGGHSEDLAPVHVVTKVWYTHLGYERTKISVQESLQNLKSTNTRQIYVHMLLHWPRCNDEIPWMNCEEEENNLPQAVKDSGPPPHLNKESAFLQSWKALEDMYTEHKKITKSRKSGEVNPIIASIGVSNFELEDMKQLLASSRIPPQIYQGSSWMIFHDPYMMDLLREHAIFFQAYAVMNGILQRKNDALNAYNILTDTAHELLTKIYSEDKNEVITEATVLLAYLIHSNIGIIPRAASSSHQLENSPKSLAVILPYLTSSHTKNLEMAIDALMKGEDLHIPISFMNALKIPIQIHWVNPDTNEEVLVSNIVHPGSVEVQRSHPGHKFVAYDPDRSIRKEYLVDARYGDEQQFKVEL